MIDFRGEMEVPGDGKILMHQKKVFSPFYKKVSRKARGTEKEPILRSVHEKIAEAAEKKKVEVTFDHLTQEQVQKLSDEGFSIVCPGEKHRLIVFTNSKEPQQIQKLDDIAAEFRRKYREEGGINGNWDNYKWDKWMVNWAIDPSS